MEVYIVCSMAVNVDVLAGKNVNDCGHASCFHFVEQSHCSGLDEVMKMTRYFDFDTEIVPSFVAAVEVMVSEVEPVDHHPFVFSESDQIQQIFFYQLHALELVQWYSLESSELFEQPDNEIKFSLATHII